MDEFEREYWDEQYGGVEKYEAMDCHDPIVEWLAHYYDLIGKRVLDVGGGTGIHALKMIERYKAMATNVDISKTALSVHSHQVRSFLIDATRVGELFREEFDFVCSIQALEHVPEKSIGIVASGMLKALKPCGKCFVSVAVESNTGDKTHVTLKPIDWWYSEFLREGFRHDSIRSTVAMKSELPNRLGWACLFLEKGE